MSVLQDMFCSHRYRMFFLKYNTRRVSRAGSPSPLDGDATDPTHMTTHFRYGDECFYGKVKRDI